MAKITVAKIGESFGAEVIGDSTATISRIRPLEEAEPGDLSFLWASAKKEKSRLVGLAQKSKATAVLLPAADPSIPAIQIITPQPIATLIKVIDLLGIVQTPSVGIHPTAVIAPSANLGADVSIGAFCVIGENVSIGADCILHPHAVVYHDAVLGERCVIHSHAVVREHVILGNDCLLQNGVVLGGDGFGYIPTPKGPERIPHIGTLLVGDGVDFGANSTADRATFGATRIGNYTKIDNLVMVGHNTKIGKYGFLCSQVGVSGSTTIGDNCILAGQVGIADHIHIGNNVQLAAQAGVLTDVPDGSRWAGHPARPIGEWQRLQISQMGRKKRRDTQKPDGSNSSGSQQGPVTSK